MLKAVRIAMRSSLIRIKSKELVWRLTSFTSPVLECFLFDFMISTHSAHHNFPAIAQRPPPAFSRIGQHKVMSNRTPGKWILLPQVQFNTFSIDAEVE